MRAVSAYLCMRAVDGTPPPLVQTANGAVQGFDREVASQTVSSFWGIPFAEPPIGERRFHYPEPYTQIWNDTLVADQQSPICSQGDSKGQEDCLYLNVYTLRKSLGADAGDRLPVMFWIYGGAYIQGDAYQGKMYDGSELVTRHDVAVVTSNYRLTVLGFNTYTQGSHGETGTQAMADQRLALQWTNDNVHSFGGNPSAITIFGESAGAFSVMFHLVSQPSWPLFSRAIMESATSEVSWFFQPKDLAEEMNRGWAEAVGCPSGDEQLACLQAKPDTAFVKIPQNYTGRSPCYEVFPSGPVIDGTQFGLMDVPRLLVEQGHFARVPLMLGANRNGGSIFEPIIDSIIPGAHIEALDHKDVERVVNYAFDPEDVSKILDTYPLREFTFKSLDPYQKQVEQMLRDVVFQCSDRRLATQWAAHGVPVYLYTFSFNFGFTHNLGLKDFHASEIFFVWRQDLGLFKKIPFRGDVQRMSDVMSCQWTAFARVGNPNGPSAGGAGMPGCEHVHGHVDDWPMFSENREFYSFDFDRQRFSYPRAKKLQAKNKYPHDEFPSDQRCDMWDTVSFPWNHGHSFATSPEMLV